MPRLIPRRFRPPIEHLADDRYGVNLDAGEVDLVLRLSGQLRDLIVSADPDDPRLRRLFPTAYHDDPERDAEYQRLMREELVASRLAAIEQVHTALTPGRHDLTMADVTSLMHGVNSLRLVVGTLLDVGEDEDPTTVAEDDPLLGEHHLYAWLSWLLEWIVRALSSGQGLGWRE